MKLTLNHKKSEVPGVESFIFKPEESFTWKAGQFLHYVLHHEPTDNRGSDRWFTISSAPFEKKVMITTRIANDGGSSFKNALSSMKEGEQIEISDIDGDFLITDISQKYIFIAGGIGITPFHSILKQADHDNHKLNITLLYSNRDQNIPYKDELDSFVKNNSNLVIHYVISPEHIDQNKIKELMSENENPFFYVSGPEPMVESFGNILKNMNVPADHIRQDWFPGYPAE